MKTNKLIEAVEKANTFEEMFDLTKVFYESKNHDFEFIKQEDGWLCKLMKIKKVVSGKDVKYKKSFVLEGKSENIVKAFKFTALQYLNKR